MKTKITAKLLSSLEQRDKPYRVHDTAQPGLLIRVLPSGHASYMVTWSRNKAATLGRVGKITLDQARNEAAQYLAEARQHGEPLAITQGRRGTASPTLREFLKDTYSHWFAAHYKGHEANKQTLEQAFAALLDHRLTDIDQRSLENARVAWLAGGNAETSANRKMAAIRGVFSRAVEWGYLNVHPMTKLKQLKTDTKGRVRYLLPDEEKRLREALDAREEADRTERDSANQWRADRNKELLPDLRQVPYSDHLKPLVLLSLNTGMRRGELFDLNWHDINLDHKVLTVGGATAKSGQTRHIPLNREALGVLQQWKQQGAGAGAGLVFPGRDGGRLDNVRKSWAGVLKMALVTGFTWHDMRHTFASKLVMAGVPLNTVRELLGHADLTMTLRYAHLAPDSKATAVELI